MGQTAEGEGVRSGSQSLEYRSGKMAARWKTTIIFGEFQPSCYFFPALSPIDISPEKGGLRTCSTWNIFCFGAHSQDVPRGTRVRHPSPDSPKTQPGENQPLTPCAITRSSLNGSAIGVRQTNSSPAAILSDSRSPCVVRRMSDPPERTRPDAA